MIPAYLAHLRNEQYTNFEDDTTSTVTPTPKVISHGTSHQIIGYTCQSGYTYNSELHTCEKNVSTVNQAVSSAKTSTVTPTPKVISHGTSHQIIGYTCAKGYLYNSALNTCEPNSTAKTPSTITLSNSIAKEVDNMNYTEFNDSTIPTTSSTPTISQMVSPCQSGYTLNSQGVCVPEGSTSTTTTNPTISGMSGWTGIILIMALALIAYLMTK